MKYLKYLVMLLVVSSITSLAGIKADNNPYYFNENIGGFNDYVDSGVKKKDELTTQEIRWVNIENNRELDIVLKQSTGAEMSAWYVLRTGHDIIFSNDRAMWIGSFYKIRVDSRIWYTNNTYVSLQWYIH